MHLSSPLTTSKTHKTYAMASPDSPESSTFPTREPSFKLLKSLSTTEPSSNFFPSPCTDSPPRFTTSISFPSSPPPSHSCTASNIPTVNSPEAAYSCLSSILKKDGQILSIAVSKNLVYTGSATNHIRVWKLPELTECAQLKSRACFVVAIQVSYGSVYAAYGDGKIRLWERTWDESGAVKHVRLGTIPNTSGIIRSYIGLKDKNMIRHMGLITSLAISNSEGILYSASVDKTVKVWRVSDFKCIETIQAHSDPINAIVVADEGILYSASDDATVRAWRRNFCSGDRAHTLTITLPAKSSPVKSLTLTSDNGVLYGGCSDGYIHFWLKGWFSGQLQYGGALQGHTHAVMCIASVADYVVSGSADSCSRVWAREVDGQHTCLAVLTGHRGPIRCVTAFAERFGGEIDEDGCTICTGSLDGVLKMWRVMRKSKESLSSSKPGYEYSELQ